MIIQTRFCYQIKYKRLFSFQSFQILKSWEGDGGLVLENLIDYTLGGVRTPFKNIKCFMTTIF